jgi:cytoskeleton-associated protein 5
LLHDFSIQPKPVLENVRKALASNNVAVRTSAVSLLGTLYLYMGDTLRRIIETEKPAIVQQINAEFDKVNF